VINKGLWLIANGIFKIIGASFQRFASSKLVVKSIESRFPALNYFENRSENASSV
jgi:hypothetical protein